MTKRVQIRKEVDPYRHSQIGTVLQENQYMMHVDWHNGKRTWEYKAVLQDYVPVLRVGARVVAKTSMSQDGIALLFVDYTGIIKFIHNDEIVVLWDSTDRIQVVAPKDIQVTD
jgi:hypothetical protein